MYNESVRISLNASGLLIDLLHKIIESFLKTENDQLFAFNTETGKSMWHYKTDAPSLILRGSGKPVVIGNAVIAGFANGELTKLDLRNTVCDFPCYEFSTTKWRFMIEENATTAKDIITLTIIYRHPMSI